MAYATMIWLQRLYSNLGYLSLCILHEFLLSIFFQIFGWLGQQFFNPWCFLIVVFRLIEVKSRLNWQRLFFIEAASLIPRGVALKLIKKDILVRRVLT